MIGKLGGLNWLRICVAVAAAACSSDDDPAEARRASCLRLRDHMVELRLGTDQTDREKHRAALRDALGNDFLALCERDLSADQLACMLAAKDHLAATRCH